MRAAHASMKPCITAATKTSPRRWGSRNSRVSRSFGIGSSSGALPERAAARALDLLAHLLGEPEQRALAGAPRR